jgi:hypothetical protein
MYTWRPPGWTTIDSCAKRPNAAVAHVKRV